MKTWILFIIEILLYVQVILDRNYALPISSLYDSTQDNLTSSQ